MSFESLSVVRQQKNRPIIFGVGLLSTDLNTPNTYNTARYVFDSITCKTEMEPDFIRRLATTTNYTSASSYNFTNANTIVSYADKNSMKVVGHALWDDPSNTPQFVKNLNLTKSTTHKNTMNTILNNHITYNITQFNNTAPNTVYTWQVTNESLDANGNVQKNAEAYQVLGDEYFANTYEYAQTALTNNSITKIKLFYNDDKNISYQLPKLLELKTAGKLDGVGIKCSTSSVSNLESVLDIIQKNTHILRKNGFEVHYTEVYYSTRSSSVSELDKQKTFYSELLKLALRYGVTNFTVWGIKDQSGTPNVPFLFNYSLVPKLCYNEMINVLKNYTIEPVNYKDDYDIFIVFGQSNAVGLGVTIDPDIPIIANIMDDDYANSINPNIKQYTWNDEIMDARERIDHLISVEKRQTGAKGNYGFAMSFARQYVREKKLEPNKKVLLIGCAWGGTGFLNDYPTKPEMLIEYPRWRTNVRNELYDRTRERIKRALGKVGPYSEIKGMLWLQGESDATYIKSSAVPDLEKPAKYEEYKRQLVLTLNGVRTDITNKMNTIKYGPPQIATNIPILLGQILPERTTDYNTMNVKIKEVTDDITNINYKYVPAVAIPSIPVFNHNLTSKTMVKGVLTAPRESFSHYNKTSQIEFGKRYYYVYNNNRINLN
jgi:GH35 family endo-1,4-beta-xylanase